MSDKKKSAGKKSGKGKNKNNFSAGRNALIAAAVLLVVIAGFMIFSDRPNVSEGEVLPSDSIEGVVAEVNGEEVTSEEVTEVQQMLAQQGQQLTEDQAKEQAINLELLSQQAEKGGFLLSNAEAEGMLESQLSSQGASLDDYKKELANQGISYDAHIEIVKEDIAMQNYINSAIDRTMLEVNAQEAEEFYNDYQAQATGEVPKYKDVEEQIFAILAQQKQQNAIGSLIQDLRAEANIEYFDD